MKCPYCGSDFAVGDIYQEKEGEVISGFVRCECSEFVIVEGILNLKIGHLNNYLIKFLKEAKPKEAVRLSLGYYAEDICRIANFLESRGLFGQALGKILLGLVKARQERAYRKYLDKNLSLYNLLGYTSFETYLKHRFSADTFWSLYPFIPIMKENKERILDLGCGGGHASFVISTYIEPKQLVCADSIFSNLYLAKKYSAKGAEFICLDANYPLPFKDGTFTLVFMLDVFHYVPGRASLASEMERVILPHGLLLLLHLHNSLNHNPATGNPLSPSGWVNLFQQLPVKVLPERNLIEDFILRNRLDIAKEYTDVELNYSNALYLVGTKDRSLFRVYEEVAAAFLSNKSHLIINPIYRIKRKRDKLILQRKFPSRSFGEEYPLTERYLPEEHTIEGKLLQIVEGSSLNLASTEVSEKDLLHIEDLMRKFIVINVPKDYY